MDDSKGSALVGARGHAKKRSVGREEAVGREAETGAAERSGSRVGRETEPGEPGAALGTSRKMLPPLRPGVLGITQLQEWRRIRFARRQRSSGWLIAMARQAAGLDANSSGSVTAEDPEWIRPPRPARCRWRVAQAVAVHGGEGHPSHFSGTERCASIWACPVCSAVIRAERATDIQTGAQTWQNNGGALLFVTLTLRHKRSDALADTLDAAIKSWRGVQQGAPWTRWKNRLGIVGSVRAVEVTYGVSNGWHPHIHVLMFLESEPTTNMLESFESWLYARWADRIVAAGSRMPTKLRGVDLRLAGKDGQVLAQYLAKTQDAAKATPSRTRIGAEIARADFKSGRGLDRLMPLELLDADADDQRAYALWTEYFTATRGRQAITWSKGLRTRLLLGEEKTEQQVVDDAERSPTVFTIPGEIYDDIKGHPTQLAAVLEAVDFGNISAAMELAWGKLLAFEYEWVDMTTGEFKPPTGPLMMKLLVEDAKRGAKSKPTATGSDG